MAPRELIVFDTTTRDGEQAGHKMTAEAKVQHARAVQAAGVTVLEAGFAASSPGDEAAIAAVVKVADRLIVASLARAVHTDIDAAVRALTGAARPRIHTFVATSDIHMEKKLRRDPEAILAMAVDAVAYARRFTDDVEFSPEDSARTGIDFLCRIVEQTIAAGATTVNIPDTVGYSNPTAFGELISALINRVPNIGNAVISVHCHNDQGLAVANSLAALRCGALQVEGCFLGIGERAGNAALEQIIMNVINNPDNYPVTCGVDTTALGPICRGLSRLIGYPIPDHQPIVGSRAFAHSSGIHRDGVLKARETYEIMTPASVGWEGVSVELVSHLGRNGLRDYLNGLGYDGAALVEAIYPRYIELADIKGKLTDEDLHMLVQEWRIKQEIARESLFDVYAEDIVYGPGLAKVTVRKNGDEVTATAHGDGPIAAVFLAIKEAVAMLGQELPSMKLVDFSVVKGRGGDEAIGWAVVCLSRGDEIATGRSGHPDTIKAAAMAYVYAINNLIHVPVCSKTATVV